MTARVVVEGASLCPAGAVPDIGPVEVDPAAGLFVSLRMSGKVVLVVGGGAVAAQRARVALRAGAIVRLVAPVVGPELIARAARGELTVARRPFIVDDLDGVDVVMTAVDEPGLSEEVAGLCRARRVLVNCADIPPLCDFYLPALHQDGPLQIAVSTGGEGPALAARLRDLVARALPVGVGAAIRRFGDLRRAIRAADPGADSTASRMSWLKARAHSASWEELSALDVDAEVVAYRGAARAVVDERPRASPPRDPNGGRVTFVGAGPGDPELITVAGRAAVEEADLVLCDRLVPSALHAWVRGELVIAGKERGQADVAQEELERRAVEGAKAGLRVVRLKIGDPGLFGRLGEELAACANAGVPTRVIPGVSSALAAAELAGVGATMRGVADQVLIATGHGAGDDDAPLPAWRPATTFVWLMAIHRLGPLTAGLRASGFPDTTPCLVVQDASLPTERSVRAPLWALADAVAAAGIRPPAVVLIGGVVDVGIVAQEQAA